MDDVKEIERKIEETEIPNKDIVDKFIKNIIRFQGEEKDKITSAAIFAAKKHGDQKRKSGEAYIIHPFSVANTLMDLGMDADTICAGLLHDTIEDTPTTYEEIERLFGKEVAQMVEGVTKISHITDNKSIQEAETIKKMFFAMSKDVRVILIKLADKLHNMKTASYLPPERRKQFAEDCLEIFAPIADSLGMSTIKCELEDLSLKVLKPESYAYINEYLLERKGEYTAYIKKVSTILEKTCREAGLKHILVQGRVKHAYSIYQKIKKRKKEIDEIYDILGIRVICDTAVECYTILGLIHSIWVPIEGRFKDYIAMPKPNNYQSLHTTVLGPGSRHLEIQIRTFEMHKTAEEGVAAHWSYKASTGSDGGAWKKADSINYNKIISKLKTWSHEIEQSEGDFMDEIKNELLKDSIIVFTPQGHVIELPVGSTALDFAFKVHSEVGAHCSGARADNSIIPLNKPLQNTQIVEILTSPNAHPTQAWLEYAQTQSARKKIKAWLNKYAQNGNIPITQSQTKEKEEEKSKTEERPIIPPSHGIKFVSHDKGSVIIGNNSNILFDFAKCCNPVHGDDIVAYITRGRGYVIHKKDCPNLKNMPEKEVRLVPVEWEGKDLVRRFKVIAKMNSELFGEIDNATRKYGAHLISGDLQAQDNGDLQGVFTISCESEDALKKTTSAIRGIPSIKKVSGV
ncbi:MAG TPA: RelA/SpoT family protein [Candidatus Ornithospirochaeta avicola]|uniref:RelA/SpoT family protein n=1 Tax=Candidatus Ornithospirochaeta avicola TaxID=2840896 RepID=A0A9D1PTR8_9SPIO|nr:RelA/SpoT family protein [Candidatus Ornithospirochaeta avicola]